ncbi:pulmonary surfactant-associated protein C-like [Protopterus annectens]|uniref:pulmonary surfactant-associated protein C-like n=1 Tax=Protopterus annectens TaxID=7888 RepID=UPI001CFA6CD1|nr:pulmonary surfactant-associated protein C-like [Protopterus annectens]
MDTCTKTDIALAPPVYTAKEMTSNRKKIIYIAGTVIALVLIAVIAILLGVFLTQKHYETIIQTTMKGQNREVNQFAATVNDKENVATFYISEGNISATLVYDYNNGVVGYRASHDNLCLLLKMDKNSFPSIDDVIHSLNKNQTLPGAQQLNLYQTGSLVVDRTVLGKTVNILCQNVPIYFAQQNEGSKRLFSYQKCWKVGFVKVCVSVSVK